MFTQCPECDAVFQLTASQLKAANGDVRCGQCLSIFSALDNLSEEVPHTQEADATEDLTHDADQHRDGSDKVTNDTQYDKDNDDVFSDVIAGVSASDIPEEEIDRFEEFLAADALPAKDSATISTKDNSVSAEPALPIEASSSIDEPQLAEDTLPSEDAAPITGKAIFTTDDPNISDVEITPVDLNAKVDINDDEFAELDAYLNASDDEYPDNVAGPVYKIDTDNDAVVAEDSSHEPVTSADNIDTPDTLFAPSVDAPLKDKKPADKKLSNTHSEEKPATQQASSADTPQTINIPTLILDDLHAAQAEGLRPSNTPWVVGSLLLMVVLVLQVVYHSRDDLARDTKLRPWLIQMCNIANCTLNQSFDIKQIEIIGRDVRTHPTARKALVVSTTLINNANYMQPFPLLTMVFSDINGIKIAQRRFTPREYLHNDIDLTAGMTPDMPVRVELELVDPGKSAVNYEFHAEVDPRRTRPLS